MKTSTVTALMPNVAEQATGCLGAGGYTQFAQDRGYTHIEVINWCSSAGDWQFIVSKDGLEWYVLWQENNWPRPGFTRGIDEDMPFFGTAEEAIDQVCNLY